jgi:flagellar basal-body rod protein FlgG
MIRGMYESAASMVSSMTRLIRLGNNLANVNTPGYKQDLSAPHAFREVLLQRLEGSADTGTTVGSLTSTVVSDLGRLDLSQGMLRATDRPLDLALSGPGFFTVVKDGATYYTRNGTFQVNAAGILSTSDGGVVQGENGAVTVGAQHVSFEEDGTVWAGAARIDRLTLVDFPEGTQFRKIGHSYIQAEGADPIAGDKASVFQGYLEGSNVNVANSMMELLTSRKTYGSSQRVLQMADGALQKAVTELGRV